jgi:hypothetical protein
MLGAANPKAVTRRMIPEQTTQRKTCPMAITGDAIGQVLVNPRAAFRFPKPCRKNVE